MRSVNNHCDLYDFSIWGNEDVSSGKGVKDENFPVGSLLISRKLRPHVQAYYNFARVIDDIADSEMLSSEEKVKRLNGMQAVLCDDVPAPDRADVQSARYLRNSLLETGVSFDTATDLLIAFRQDAVKNRYETFAELLEYCRYSANPVGHYLLDLHKENADTKPAADALCTSLQILNHLQDCRSDLIRLDRCYIPLDMLRAENVDVQAVKDEGTISGLRNVFDYILDYIDDLNREAEQLIRLTSNRRLRMEISVILTLACSLTEHLRKEDPLATRVKLNYKDAIKAVLYACPHILR
ncbi:squalene/phytoene synthase family protein [Commensalibacter melissae]|uniref:squalene/phytoene synthase family protein n=1 Tax=Commensalibacter melissae TaxID=2070537 RepID=UPI000EFC9447|nr:squalene/phytoene synthase family protein [Commensalibacter melissae]AYN87473.1 squalene synthase HpnC [Commensalibacter melissae]